MEQLPLELSLKIFGHLDLADLIALRLVCKKFELIVREVKIKELIFVKGDIFWWSGFTWDHYKDADSLDRPYQSWFFENDLQEFSAFFTFSKYLLSDGPFHVRSLRRLSIRSLSDVKGIDIEDINRFDQLEHLEIGFDQRPLKSSSMCSLFDKQPRQVPRLCLANLQVLSIISYFNQRGLQIDAPKLKALKLPKLLKAKEGKGKYNSTISYNFNAKFNFECFFNRTTNDLSSLQFKHSESIKFLRIPYVRSYYDDDEVDIDDDEFDLSRYLIYIGRFRNVEHLFLDFSDVLDTLGSYIYKFPKLKTLDIPSKGLSLYYYQKIISLIESLAALPKPNLKVYYMGIELLNDQRLVDDFLTYINANEAYRSYDKNSLHSWQSCPSTFEFMLQLKNRSLLSVQREPVHKIYYHKLIDTIQAMLVDQVPEFSGKEAVHVRNRLGQFTMLPSDFFELNSKVASIEVTKRIGNEIDFTKLVKNCKNLRKLVVTNSQLTQSFFDELPAISLLSFLTLEETTELNMHFLSRMNHLIDCQTNQSLSTKVLLKLAKTRYFRLFHDTSKYSFVSIRRSGRDRYSLRVCSHWYSVNSKSLTEHLYRAVSRKNAPNSVLFNFILKTITIIIIAIIIITLSSAENWVFSRFTYFC